ncbi:MAG: FecR domain-containing protein [Petrimonas sp.]|nr:FecR domain-containing protein [Petrimonas sp.]
MKGKNISSNEKAAITRDLFERYRQGKTTQRENEMVESLENELIPEKEFEVTGDLLDELDNETKGFIFQQTSVKLEKSNPRAKRRVLSPVFIGSAASIALLIIGIALFYTFRGSQADLSSARIAHQYITEKNREDITLPDGSKATLNIGTTLSLREGGINPFTREIWLDEGEAFFDVRADKARPFIVHLRNGLKIQVLGTSFTIQSYKELPYQEISVLNGKVKVTASDDKSVELSPNQKALYREAGNDLRSEPANSTQIAAWRTGTIVLEKASLEELRFRIRQLYDKKVIFEDAPQKMSINITFDKKTSVNDIAAEIAALYRLSYRITDSEIIFSRKIRE